MINLLLGAPGGGKSYEATVYHILPALNQGRKVITNLPVNVEEFERIVPGTSNLLLVRQQEPGQPRPFSIRDHYGDTWRGEGGRGPLYVIDECHEVIPATRVGNRGTPQEIEEWFAMHRHEGVDVLLLTQSYGKISTAIRDLVQLVYKVRKNVAFGSMGSYTRKVQDGIRGAVVNTSVRKYNAKYYPLYQSHTQSSEAVQELMTQDVKPIWRHWSFILSALLLPASIIMLLYAGNPLKPKQAHAQQIQPTKPDLNTTGLPKLSADGTLHPQSLANGGGGVKVTPQPQPKPKEEKKDHPYHNLEIHVAGYLEAHNKAMYIFAISQNGQIVFIQSQSEIEKTGYKVEPLSDCSVRLEYKEWSEVVVCDAPSQHVGQLRQIGVDS